MSPSLTISHLDLPTLQAEMKLRGWRTGRSEPLLRALCQGLELDPARFGEPVVAWARSLPLTPMRELSTYRSPDGTFKLLLQLHDGHTVECVLMPTDRPGIAAACVSSQVGCAMACDFCASTLDGLKRNLTAEEITGQYLLLRQLAVQQNARLATLVFMGMGEPMHNLANVVPAIHRICDPTCAGLGYRNVQVSTVGIVPGIRTLADSDVRVALALSLHGPDDATRSQIVPAGKKYTVAATLDAAWEYQEKTGRVSNIEYCLLADVNDSPRHAQLLVEAIAGRRMHVNLIPHNPIGAGLSGITYRRPSAERITSFLQTLRDGGVVTHLRKTRGDDTSAACGQLRRTSLTVSAGTPVSPA